MTDTMRALNLSGSWNPKAGYTLTDFEKESGKALNGNTIWQHPKLELMEKPIPRIEDDEVLVRVSACGVCGSDTHCYETDEEGYIIFSGPVKLPVTLGHEYTGVVVDKGRRVKTLDIGTLVAPEGMLWCGLCPVCRTGHPNQCQHLEMVGFSSAGAFAEYIAVKEKYCWDLSDLEDALGDRAMAEETGALIEPIGCAYNGMFISAGGFKPGAYVAIYGAGPIGLGAVLMARAAGAGRIFVFETIEDRRALALTLGADYAEDPVKLAKDGSSVHEFIRDHTKGYGADVQVEAAGAAQHTVPEIEKSFAPNGKMVYLGRTGDCAKMYLDTLVSQANQIVGARGHAGYGIYPNIIRMLATGRIPAHRMITSRYPFDRVLDALRASSTRRDGKIMVGFAKDDA